MLSNPPISGATSVLRHFGENPPRYRRFSFRGHRLSGHDGMDFDAAMGTPVHAVQKGQVLGIWPNHVRFGRAVLLGHEWGQSVYGHLNEIQVTHGQTVGEGQVVGSVGQSGMADRPHLHFALRVQPFDLADGWCGYSDPAPYLQRLTEPAGAMMGPHIIGGVTSHLDLLRRWQPRLITVLDPSPNEMVALREACPDAVIVGRIFVPDHEMDARIRDNPEEAAQWAHTLTMSRFSPQVNYWQIANEILQERDGLDLLARFEVRRMQLAATVYLCAILAFGVGHPDLPEADRMEVWRLAYPALEMAEKAGHIVAVHQYGLPDLFRPAQDWFAYRLEHQVLRRLPFKKLQFAITEYGIDGMIAGGEPRGWQHFADPAAYAEQLLRSGRYLERFSGRVLGYSIFTLGHNNPWQSYDIAGEVAGTLAGANERGTWHEIQWAGTGLRPDDPNPAQAVGSDEVKEPAAPGPNGGPDGGTAPVMPPPVTPERKPPTPEPTSPATEGDEVVTAAAVTQRLTEWFDDLNLEVQPLDASQSPDDTIYELKDVFTTINGSWNVSADRYAIPQWAKDAYEDQAVLMELQKQSHLYAAVVDGSGQLLKDFPITFTNRFDPSNPSTRNTQSISGWATFTLFSSGSTYHPGQGEQGPWCWAPAGSADLLCGGGLPGDGQSLSIFAVWQAVPRTEVTPEPSPEPTPEPSPEPSPEPTPEPSPEPSPEPTPEPAPTPALERRQGTWVDDLRLAIKGIDERPDKPPTGDLVYLIKDVFTTRDGSWEPSEVFGSVDQWARDAYLKPLGDPEFFDDAGGDHHLFAAVLGLDGKFIRHQDILYWSDGFEMLGDPDYDGYAVGANNQRYPQTKEKSGWINIPMSPDANYVPERGEQGPWCWVPRGLPAEVMCGGGMPAKQHVSVFVVWQAVKTDQAPGTKPGTGDHDIFLPFVSGGVAPGAAAPPPTPSAAAPTYIAEAVLEAIRGAAWSRLGVELRPGSILAAYARRSGLGMPVTQEFVTAGYRVQGFLGGIVIAPVKNPEQVRHVLW